MHGLRLPLRLLTLALPLGLATGVLLCSSLAQEPTAYTLEPLPQVHTTITRQLSRTNVHRYEINLDINQYFELTLTKGDLRVAAAVFGPEDDLIAEFTSRQFEPLHVCFISRGAGKFRVELRSLETTDSPTAYHLEVVAQRPANGQDVKAAAARRLLIEAGKLRAAWNESSMRQSLLKLSEALDLWQAIGLREETAETLLLLGDTHLLLSEYPQAETRYLQATKVTGISDASVRFRAFTRAGYVNVYLSQNQKALDYAQLALNYYARVRSRPGGAQERRDEAEAQNAAGEATYSKGRLNQATKFFTRALQLSQAAGDRAGQALANLNLAYCYSDLGDLMKAQECLHAALTLSQAIGDKRGEAMALTAYGTIQSFWGEKQAALDKHGQAMNIFRMVGDHAGEAVALNSIGKAYEDLNEPRVALDKYHQALAIYEQLGNGEFEAVTRYYIGRVHRTLGENQNALGYFQQCLKQGQQLRHPRLIVYALAAISALRNADGHGDEALQGLQRVLKLYRDMRDRRGQANVLTEIGRIYESKEKATTALEYYRRALPLTKAAGDRKAEAATLYLIALAERNSGDLTDALKTIEESNEVIESLRTQIVNPELRASYFASVQKHSALHIDLLTKLDKLYPERHLAERAFEINDSARARALLEIIGESSAKIRQGIDPALLAQERALQEQLTARASYHMRALNAEDKDESEIAERELRELATAYQELQTQIRQQSPRYLNLISPEPLRLKEIQSELRDPNTLLLEYALGDERSYVWAVTADSFSAFELPSRSKIEAAAQEATKLLTARQVLAETEATDYVERAAASDVEYWRQAAILSEMILKPVAQLIRGKRLLIIAEGKLQYVSFDALPIPIEGPDQQPEELAPLVTSNEIVILPSASLLKAIRVSKPIEQSGKLVAVVADPVFERSDPRVHASAEASTIPASLSSTPGAAARDLQYSALRGTIGPHVNSIPRLLATREEAEEIMALTPAGEGFVAMDFKAGRAIATTGELGQYQIVHFATHGIVNTEHPELSGIMLSLVNRDGQNEDGFLQLHDIYNLDLSRTQLVVLSACRTALGKEVRGEGLMSLTRGFMYAGSKSVIASLWKVDDRATAELMKHFYYGMFEERLPPATALRKAKETMWRQSRWRAPFFWAAFVLQGEYRDTIVVNRESHTWTYSAVVVGLFSLLALGRYATKSRRTRP